MLYRITGKLKDYIENIDYNEYISVIRINLSNKITDKYNHRIYLGALMKLGLKREKIGDILIDDDGADLIVCKEISDFLYIPDYSHFLRMVSFYPPAFIKFPILCTFLCL